MAIYMKIDGIQGNVTAKGHENWIELESLHFNVRRNVNTKPGRITDRESGIPEFDEILITKHIDPSSAQLFQQACKGKSKPTVEIDLCGTDSELQPYLKLKLTNSIISQYSNDTHACDDLPLEAIKLNFTKLEKTFISRDNNNKPQSPMTAGYDLGNATSI